MKKELIIIYAQCLFIPTVIALLFMTLLESYHSIFQNLKLILLNSGGLALINLPIFALLISEKKFIKILISSIFQFVVPLAYFSYWILEARNGGEAIIFVVFSILNLSVNTIFFISSISKTLGKT